MVLNKCIYLSSRGVYENPLMFMQRMNISRHVLRDISIFMKTIIISIGHRWYIICTYIYIHIYDMISVYRIIELLCRYSIVLEHILINAKLNITRGYDNNENKTLRGAVLEAASSSFHHVFLYI